MEKKQAFEPKTVTCALCKLVVSKRSTIPINSKDRICRTHPEAKELNEKWVQQQIRAKAAPLREEQKKERKQNLRPKEKPATPMGDNDPKILNCFSCGKSGVSMRDFYMRFLIEEHKLSLSGENFNLFDPKSIMKIKEKMPEEHRRPIVILSPNQVSETYGKGTFNNLLDLIKDKGFLVKNLVLNGDLICICHECLESKSLQYLARPKETPAPSVEQMFRLGSIIDPILDDIAMQELKAEKK